MNHKQKDICTKQEEPRISKEGEDLSKYIGGVGGWLLIFCISLVVGPFLRLSEFHSVYESIPLVDEFSGLKTFIILHGIFIIGLAIFSVYAGLSLWRIRPKAVKIAKIYLLAFVAYPFLALFFPSIVGFPPDLKELIFENSWRDVFLPLIWGSFWFLYLTNSKRVKGTYGL